MQLPNNTTRTYCYDANGNLTSDSAGLAIQYDHQNLPTKATRGSQTDWFRYGPDGMRTRSWGADGARVYLPGYEHRTDTGETKVYVGDYAVISRTGSTRKVECLLKDRLGSVDAVANSSGSVIETRGYDAFGKPRDGAWNDLNPAKIASTAVTPKGFTQHEHLNPLELIHMNGRAYDYHLGRFAGVDPFIQFPLNSQSLNPYSYILNNPLSGTDPTGYSCVPMTGSHLCGTDTGAENGQSTSSRTQTLEDGARITTTRMIYANGPVTTTTRISMPSNGAEKQGSTDSSARINQEGRPQSNLLAKPRSTNPEWISGNLGFCIKCAAGDPEERIRTKEVNVSLSISERNRQDGYDNVNDAAIAQYKAYIDEYIVASSKNPKMELLGLIFTGNKREFFSTMVEVPVGFEANVRLNGIKASQISAFTHTHPGDGRLSNED